MAIESNTKGVNPLPSRSFLLVPLALCMSVYGCGGTRASRSGTEINQRTQASSLTLTSDQIAFIEKNVPKAIAWQMYWTQPDASKDPSYAARAGKSVSAKYVNLECAVMIWIDDLRYSSVVYVKMPDGQLDYPGFLGYTDGNADLDDLLKSGNLSSTSWHLFLLKLDYFAGPGLSLAPEQKEKYRQQFKSISSYSLTDGEVTLPPLGPPTYEASSETKERLLERITTEAVEQCNKMYREGETVTITIPNFNVGDPRIWVLMEPQRGRGVIIDIQLCTNPKDEPVIFGSVVNWDIKVDRYGVKDDTIEKIRDQLLKVWKHRVGGSSH